MVDTAPMSSSSATVYQGLHLMPLTPVKQLICMPMRLQVKPDGVQRGLVGEIVGRFERKGFTLRGLKLFTPGKELAEEHYKDLSQKPFFKDLVDYITSGPVVAMVRLLISTLKLLKNVLCSAVLLEVEVWFVRGSPAISLLIAALGTPRYIHDGLSSAFDIHCSPAESMKDAFSICTILPPAQHEGYEWACIGRDFLWQAPQIAAQIGK